MASRTRGLRNAGKQERTQIDRLRRGRGDKPFLAVYARIGGQSVLDVSFLLLRFEEAMVVFRVWADPCAVASLGADELNLGYQGLRVLADPAKVLAVPANLCPARQVTLQAA